MALKDWKKTRESKQGIRWENTKQGKVVFVHTLKKKNGFKSDVIATEFQDWNKPRNNRFNNKYFKTKTQALVYAKAYMRKH